MELGRPGRREGGKLEQLYRKTTEKHVERAARTWEGTFNAREGMTARLSLQGMPVWCRFKGSEG